MKSAETADCMQGIQQIHQGIEQLLARFEVQERKLAEVFLKPVDIDPASQASSASHKPSKYSVSLPSMPPPLLGDVDFEVPVREITNKRRTVSRMLKREEERKRKALMQEDAVSMEHETDRPVTSRTSKLVAMLNWWVTELCLGSVVFLSIAIMGIQVEYERIHPHQTNPILLHLSQVVNVIFLIELVLRVAAFRGGFFYGENMIWNLLDLIVVLIGTWELIMDIVIASSQGIVSNVHTVRMIRVLRLTRVVRVTKISRILRFVKALRVLVISILHTLQSIVWSALLLLMVIYFFGIIFAQTAIDFVNEQDRRYLPEAEEKALEAYWLSLPRAMLTLFLVITNGVNDSAANPLFGISILWGIVFLVYVGLSYFAILNVLTAVFCGSAIETARNDRELAMYQLRHSRDVLASKLREIFGLIDIDASGDITMHEIQTFLDDCRGQDLLASLQLCIRDAWSFFKLCDKDQDCVLSLDEFVTVCQMFQGDAKSLDLATLHAEQGLLMHQQTVFMTFVKDNFTKLDSHLAFLAAQLDTLCDSKQIARADHRAGSHTHSVGLRKTLLSL